MVGALVARVAPRPVPAALLSGMLVSVWPHLAYRIYQSRSEIRGHPLYARVTTGYYRAFRPLYRLRYREQIREEEEREREWERQRRARIELYGFDPKAEPPPQLRELERVVAIGGVQSYPGGRLVLVSLEAYRDGCIVHARLLSDEDVLTLGGSGAQRFRGGIPELDMEASDDLGRRYPVREGRCAYSGSEAWYELQIPRPLDPLAGELTVTVARIRWEDADCDLGDRAANGEETGPWIFQVPL